MKSGVVAFLTGLLIFFGLETMLFFPKFFYLPLGLMNLAIVFSIYLLAREKRLDWTWINFSFLPLIFVNSLVLACGLIPQITFWNKLLLQAIFCSAIYFFLFYARNLWLFFNFPERPNNLNNFSLGLAIVTAFFCSSSIFGLQLFLNLPYLVLTIIISVLLVILIFCNLWIAGLASRELWSLLLVLFFIFIQIIWTLYFLPFDYNAIAFIMTLVFYLSLNLVRLNLRQTLNRYNLKPLLIYAVAVFVIILATVRWR